MSEIKNEALEKATQEYVQAAYYRSREETFRAGAEWQKEQFAQLFMDLNYQVDLISPFDVSEAGLLAQKIRTILKKFDV